MSKAPSDNEQSPGRGPNTSPSFALVDSRIKRELDARGIVSGGGHGGSLEARVAKLESDVDGIKRNMDMVVPKILETNTFISTHMPHLATKADLASKPSKEYMWLVLGVLVAAMIGAGTIVLALKSP